VIALGYSAEENATLKERRPFEETVTFNKF